MLARKKLMPWSHVSNWAEPPVQNEAVRAYSRSVVAVSALNQVIKSAASFSARRAKEQALLHRANSEKHAMEEMRKRGRGQKADMRK